MVYDDAHTVNEPYVFLLDGVAMDATVTASIGHRFVPPNSFIHFFENCDESISNVTHKSKATGDVGGRKCTVHISLSDDNVIIAVHDEETRDMLFSHCGKVEVQQ